MTLVWIESMVLFIVGWHYGHVLVRRSQYEDALVRSMDVDAANACADRHLYNLLKDEDPAFLAQLRIAPPDACAGQAAGDTSKEAGP